MNNDWIVSLYNNVEDIIPKDFSLFEWIQMTKDPPENYRKLVDKYQSTMLRKDKIKIPCISIHSSYKIERLGGNEKHKNNLICIDIDRKKNICIDMQMMKEFLCRHPSTLYAGFSVSGCENGVFAIIVIGENDRLLDYFEYFRESFQKKGINIDETCKDYTRVRFFNIDEEAYFNPFAKPFKLALKEQLEEKQPQKKIRTSERDFEVITNADKAYKIIEIIERENIDITSNYNDWVKIGAALAREFGEDGRSMFHRISNKHPKYNTKDCDKKYDSCKKMNKINFSSLFYIAESYGIKY